MAWDYSGFTRIGAGIGGAVADKRKAEEEERRRKAQSQAFVRTSGLSQTDPAIAAEIESGNLGIDEGMTALRTKQAQEKIRKEAEEAADQFMAQQQAKTAETKDAEGQMTARRNEEVNLNASGALRGTPPALHGPTAANVADETNPSQQFSMRGKLQEDAEKAADQFFLQNEKGLTQGAAGAVVRNVVTPSEAGLQKPMQPKAERPQAESKPSKPLVSTEKVQSIYQKHFDGLKKAIPEGSPIDEDRIHQQAMANTAKEVDRLTEVSGGGDYDSIVADLEAQIQDAIEELQRLKSE